MAARRVLQRYAAPSFYYRINRMITGLQKKNAKSCDLSHIYTLHIQTIREGDEGGDLQLPRDILGEVPIV